MWLAVSPFCTEGAQGPQGSQCLVEGHTLAVAQADPQGPAPHCWRELTPYGLSLFRRGMSTPQLCSKMFRRNGPFAGCCWMTDFLCFQLGLKPRAKPDSVKRVLPAVGPLGVAPALELGWRWPIWGQNGVFFHQGLPQ